MSLSIHKSVGSSDCLPKLRFSTPVKTIKTLYHPIIWWKLNYRPSQLLPQNWSASQSDYQAFYKGTWSGCKRSYKLPTSIKPQFSLKDHWASGVCALVPIPQRAQITSNFPIGIQTKLQHRNSLIASLERPELCSWRWPGSSCSSLGLIRGLWHHRP